MSERDPAVPGSPVNLPVPPDLAEAFGYPGRARYVVFYWTPAGDEVAYDDGRMSGTGATWTFLTYRRYVDLHITLRILSGVLRLQGLDVARGPSGRSTPDRIQLN